MIRAPFRRARAMALALIAMALAPVVAQQLPFIGEAHAASRSVASLADIRRLAAEAYVWGLGPEFTWRFAKYNTTISAPINALTICGAIRAAPKSVLRLNSASCGAPTHSAIQLSERCIASDAERLIEASTERSPAVRNSNVPNASAVRLSSASIRAPSTAMRCSLSFSACCKVFRPSPLNSRYSAFAEGSGNTHAVIEPIESVWPSANCTPAT